MFYGYDDDFVLDQLSYIKLVNFRGTRFELQLLAFLLKRTPGLEQLVLVTVREEGGAPGDERVIQGWVSAMQKVSPEAQLTVCSPCAARILCTQGSTTNFWKNKRAPFDPSTSTLR